MTRHITLITLITLATGFVAAPAAAQAYDCWPVRCATTQASTKPGLKKVEDKKKAGDASTKTGEDKATAEGATAEGSDKGADVEVSK